MGEGKRGVMALGEKSRGEVFAVVEACVRMLLLSLVQREKAEAGCGEAGVGGGGRGCGGGGGGGGGEQGGGEDAGDGAVETAGGDEDCPRYASAGTSLYLDFRFLETRGLHKCAPR